MLSLIPVIYNSLGQNKSKELELWPNNKYEIRTYSFQKISSGPTDSNYQIRDGSRFVEWGLAGEGGLGNGKGTAPGKVLGAKPQNQGLVCGAPNSLLFSNQRSYFIGKFCIMHCQ